MLIKDAIQLGGKVLAASNIPNSAREARLLLQFVTKLSDDKILFNYEQTLNSKQKGSFEQLLARRAKSEPLAKIIGKKFFWDDEFITSQDTLDPRPDSETIIESCIKYFSDSNQSYRILDLGVGTGCLLLSLLKIYSNSIGIGNDISAKALKIAKQNIINLKLEQKVLLTRQNWLDGINGYFDIIIANPPYIKTEDIEQLDDAVKKFDPLVALDGGKDGLDCYRYLSKSIKKHLSPNGMAFIEFGQNQENDLIEIFTNEDYQVKDIVKDLNNIYRIIIVSCANV